MAHQSFDARGMSCGHCKKAVEGALIDLAGVSAVEVDLETGKIDVTYDEAKVSLEIMKQAVEEQGYDIV